MHHLRLPKYDDVEAKKVKELSDDERGKSRIRKTVLMCLAGCTRHKSGRPSPRLTSLDFPPLTSRPTEFVKSWTIYYRTNCIGWMGETCWSPKSTLNSGLYIFPPRPCIIHFSAWSLSRRETTVEEASMMDFTFCK